MGGRVDDVGEENGGQYPVEGRLDTLSAEEKLLVQNAAVVGRTAWVGAVCAIGDHSPRQAEELIHSLERKQLMRHNRRSSVAGEVEFTFGHALTQEVAYSQIRRSHRAEKHQRAAAWIEGLSGHRDDKAELLAHHYTTALELRQRAGEDTTSLLPKARAALIEAGRQAQAVNAHQAAARHVQAALDLTTEDDRDRAPLLLEYATARHRAALADEPTLANALDAQIAAEDWRGAAWAEYMLGDWVEHVLGDGDRADHHYARAAAYAGRVSETEMQSLVAHSQAARLNVTGQAAESIAFIDEVIRGSIAAGDDKGRGLLLDRRGWARMGLGDAGGIDDHAEAARILAAHAHPRATLAYSNLGESLAGLGDLEAAREARAQAQRLAERFGEPADIAWVRAGQAEGRYQAGDWDEAFAVTAGYVEDNDRLNAAWSRYTRGLIALARGDTELARTDSDEICAYATSSHNAEAQSMGLALRALALDHAGHDDQARAAYKEFLANWPMGGAATRAPVLAEVAATLGRHGPDPRIAHAASLLAPESRWRDAITATADGRHTDSVDLYHHIGSRPLQAHAHLLVAQTAAREARHADAAGHAQQALDFYQEVGATLYSEQATALLRASA